MKPCALTALFFAGLGLLAGHAWSRPVDLSIPTVEVGAANSFGYLEIWRQINEVGLQLGKDSYLPLRYKFSSEPNIGGMLGPGFYVPMFESRNILIREQMMRAFLPCGKGIYLRRDSLDQNKFQSVDGVWTGYLTDDNFIVWRDDGWKLLYHKSRLSSLTTDDNHNFSWSYSDAGMPTGVSEDGRALITVESDGVGKVTAFVFNFKRYEVTYAERPITETLLGQVAIKELDPALSSFKYPDGKLDTFKFALTPDLVPTLDTSDKDGVQTHYAWDAASSHLVNENEGQENWTYKIGDITQDFGQPPVTRTNSEGKSESVVVDNQAGLTTRTDLDGEVTVRKVFKTPGPLYDKVREITDSVGQNVVHLRFGYDETGRLIRKIDTNGFITAYTYDAAGQIANQVIMPPADPAIVSRLQAKEKVLVSGVDKAGNPTDKDHAIEQLALFYIYEMGNNNKALALVPSLAHPSWAYNIEMHAILGNQNLTSAERAAQLEGLLSKFPDEKAELSSEIDIFNGKINGLATQQPNVIHL